MSSARRSQDQARFGLERCDAADGNGKTATITGTVSNIGNRHAAAWAPVSPGHQASQQLSQLQADDPVVAILKQVALGSLQPTEAAILLQQQAFSVQQVGPTACCTVTVFL